MKINSIKVINSTPQDDFDMMTELISQGQEVMKQKLRTLGSGADGTVYLFIGKDKFEYAIKYVVNCDKNENHDGHWLSQLQGHKVFLKMFFYVEGEAEYEHRSNKRKGKAMAMVTKRVKGYEMDKISENNNLKSYFGKTVSNQAIVILKDGLNHAVKLGILPKDLHGQNIMYDTETCEPVIIDTSRFETMRDREKSNYKDYSDVAAANGCVEDFSRSVTRGKDSYNNELRKQKEDIA